MQTQVACPAFLGIDVGTSGIRAIIINNDAHVLACQTQAMPAAEQPQPHYFEQQPQLWWQTLQTLLTQLAVQFDFKQIVSMSLDATSGTVLLIDSQGQALSKGLMYNDQRASEFVEPIKQWAPKDSPTCTATSGLAKALWLLQQYPQSRDVHLTHQADWLTGQLTHHFQQTDSNNALKTGYDPVKQQWPQWLSELGLPNHFLPQVTHAGTPIGLLSKEITRKFGFSEQVLFVSGTTDSTAALLATGANQIGDAVTSLGSTLVLKIISDKAVFSSAEGIYSQPFGKHWLVGGASNTGGAVLRHYFTDAQMTELETQLNPDKTTGLHYYPLLQTGERFPENNPEQAPCLTPRPDNDAVFFQAILEGISQIELQGYQKLQQCGAPKPKRLFSIGGGANNTAWTKIRSRLLNIPLHNTLNNHAAFGAALLAKQGYDKRNKSLRN